MSKIDVGNITEQLMTLSKLRRDGVLSDDEFTSLKTKLLADELDAVSDSAKSVPMGAVLNGTELHRDPSSREESRSFGGRLSSLVDAMNAVGAIAVVLALVAFFGFPLLYEGAGTACDATEKLYVRATLNRDYATQGDEASTLGKLLLPGLQSLSGGRYAAVAVQQMFPQYPDWIGCRVFYFGMWFYPEGFLHEAEG